MKIHSFFKYSCVAISVFALSSCQTFQKKTENAGIFGRYNNVTIKYTDLSFQEKSAIMNAETKLYNTAQKIIENHYLESWFAEYQQLNKFTTIEQAKKDYFNKNAPVSDTEVKQFISENENSKEIQQIPENERSTIIKQYLTKVAHAQAEQNILEKAYQENKIEISAYKKPVEDTVIFQEAGNIYNSKLKNPKVTITEFADYQCPFCVKANPVIMKIIDEYKDKVQYVFMDFPLLDKHPQALPAAIAAKCAGNQGKYWQMHSSIFDRKPMAELKSNMYIDFAQKLGLNLTEFKECLNDPSQKEPIEANLNEGLRVGVDATPTFYINGQKFNDYVSYSNLKEAINKTLVQ
jgi:protein-disulfide isomerase